MLGFVEGKNLRIEYRWSEGVFDRIPVLAAELVRRHCSVIVGAGNAAALALKAATTTIPIVFATGDDPVRRNCTSLGRPGGNITGVWFFSGDVLQSKRLELLRDAIPGITTIGILVNRNSPAADAQAKEAQTTAHAFGQQIKSPMLPANKTLTAHMRCSCNSSPALSNHRRRTVYRRA